MESIIDIIVLILVGVVPAIMKAVSNKLEKSGKADKTDKIKRIAEAMQDDDKSVFDDPPVEPVALEPSPVVVVEPKVSELDITDYIGRTETEVKRQIKRIPPKPAVKKKPILVENEPEKKVEKIDPKKLVIYSEIMKPKY